MTSEIDNWPFRVSHDTTCYVDRRILEGSRPILQFVCEPGDDLGQCVYHAMTGEEMQDTTVIAIVCLDHVLSIDPSLAQIAHMPVGWEAVRDDASAHWHTRLIDDDDDEVAGSLPFGGH